MPQHTVREAPHIAQALNNEGYNLQLLSTGTQVLLTMPL